MILPDTAAAAGASPTARHPSPDELLSPFNQAIPHAELSSGYKLGVFFVAGLMVLLPALFFSALGLTVLALVVHMVVSLSAAGTSGLVCVVFDVVLLAAGVLFGLFLLKPLLAPPDRPHAPVSLTPEQQPLLFAFVERLCACVGAPMPSRIDVNTDVNAGASFRRGLWSVFGGGDLVLTIGLPLAAGLPLNQLTGVLAHELGHFRQGSAMRLGFLIDTINTWFYRVVLERDAWDRRLAQWAGQPPPVNFGAYCLLVPVWITRRMLWMLMVALRAVSCYLSRQMEFDADMSEIHVSGSKAFERTSLNLYALNLALDWAQDDLICAWRENRLSDNLPALVMTNVSRIQERPRTAAKVKHDVLEAKTGFLDTHPSTAERIERTRNLATAGIFHIDVPARMIFADFAAVCRKATWEYYHAMLGDEVSAKNLVANRQIAAEQAETRQALKTLWRYFQGRVVGWREVFLPTFDFTPPDNPQRAVEFLRHTQQKIALETDRVAGIVWQYEKAEERLKDLSVAALAHEVGLQFNPYDFGMVDNSPMALYHTRQAAANDLQAAQAGLNEVLRTAQARMIAALRLLQIPEVMGRVEGAAQLNVRCRRTASTLAALERAWPSLLQLRDRAGELEFLLINYRGNERNHLIVNRILGTSSAAVHCMQALLHQLANISYPFEHADGRISIAQYTLKQLPNSNRFDEVFSATSELLDKLMSLYYRSLAQITVAGEKVELACGLPRLPEVEDPLAEED